MTLASSINAPGAAARKGPLGTVFDDLRAGIAQRELWLFLGWRDVKKHYSRSVIGPFWLTINMGLMVGGLGILYSQIFGQDIATYLPFLAIGFILWGFIGSAVSGACEVFSGASSSIRQIRLPLSVYIFQFVWKNFITLAHNFTIYIIVAIIFGIWPGVQGLLVLPALLIYALLATFAAMILGPLSARFRDIPMSVASLVQVAFFMTPVIWSPQQLPERALFLVANPFYHLLEIAREALLGRVADPLHWAVSIGLTMALGIVAIVFLARYRARISYWA